MAKVLKGNKQLTVDETKVEEFLQLGYSQIDEKGEIIKPGKATSEKELKEENATLKAENQKSKKAIEKLKAENEKLKAELEKLKAEK